MTSHVDSEWIREKIGGHGGAYSCTGYSGRAVIHYIGGVSRVRIMWYNTQLFLRYLRRLVRRDNQ